MSNRAHFRDRATKSTALDAEVIHMVASTAERKAAHGRISPMGRVWLFTACVALAAAGLHVGFVHDLHTPEPPFDMSFWLLGVLFMLAEIAVVHVQLRREVYTWSLSEIPMVLGLFFATPSVLVAAHVIGAGLALLFHRRQRSHKLVFNLANFWFQTCILLIIYGAVVGNDPVRPCGMGWSARCHADGEPRGDGHDLHRDQPRRGASPEDAEPDRHRERRDAGQHHAWHSPPRRSCGSDWRRRGSCSSLRPSSTSAYRGYTTQREKHDILERLYASTQVLQRSLGEHSVVTELLVQARQMLAGEMAEILIFPERGDERGLPVPAWARATPNRQNVCVSIPRRASGPVWRLMAKGS